MYDHRMTTDQAKAATRYFVVAFHEELPAVDGTTEAVIIMQFVRELSALIQYDVDIDDVVELLEGLDRLRNIYYRVLDLSDPTRDFSRINEFDARAEETAVWDVFGDDLNRALANYSPRAPHYFLRAA
jgi:hypothetical protein